MNTTKDATRPSESEIKVKLRKAEEATRRAQLMKLRAEYIKQEIKGLIELLPNPEEREVLTAHYVDGLVWGDVSERLFGSADDYKNNEPEYLKRVFRLYQSAVTHLADEVDAAARFQEG